MKKMNFRIECKDINLTFCNTVKEIKKNWNKITKYINQNRKFYDGNESEIYSIFKHAQYAMEFEGKIISNIFREGYYELKFYQMDNHDDVEFDFKPEKIDKTLDLINQLLQSESPLDSLIGKLGVDVFYMYQFTLDKVVNPLFVIMTDDGDGWEDNWQHYVTARRFNTINFDNLKYIPYYYRQAYCGYVYGENFAAHHVYKVYIKQNIDNLYIKIEAEIDDNGEDTFWEGEIVGISTKQMNEYELLENINNYDECQLYCGSSWWNSKYDDPMDI